MTDTNQKLREALQVAEAALSDIGDADREPGDDLAWCERRAAQSLPLIRQALALPTAAQVDDINVAESFTSAAPVGEREAFEAWILDAPGYFGASVKRDQEGQYKCDITESAWDAWQARAALSAGDAVDGPLIDEGSKPALSPLSDKDAIALIEEHTNDDNVIHAHEAIELIRSVERAHGIDAAMRKGQP